MAHLCDGVSLWQFNLKAFSLYRFHRRTPVQLFFSVVQKVFGAFKDRL